jgi:oxygen-dependent protoporphyrinogen oxidase
MMSFKDGMQTLITKLGENMAQVRAYMGTSATTLQGLELGWKVTLSTQEELQTDAVCLALPAWASADILKDTDPGLAQTLQQIPHVDSLSVYYALKKSAIGKPIEGSGMLAPKPERKSFTACTLVHNKFTGRAPDGCALLRAFNGGKSVESLWGLSDGDIEKKIFADLRGLLQIQGTPIFTQLFRYRKAMPLYSTGHLDRLEVVRQHLAALPTLALAGNWRQGVGVPDCIDSGERAADQVVMDLCQA